jgi:hypothetical protein
MNVFKDIIKMHTKRNTSRDGSVGTETTLWDGRPRNMRSIRGMRLRLFPSQRPDLEREGVLSPPFSAELKNVCSYTSTPPYEANDLAL